MSASKFAASMIVAALSLTATSTQVFSKGLFDQETVGEGLQKQGLNVVAKNIPRELLRLPEGSYDVTGNVEKPCSVTVFQAPIYTPASARKVVTTDCKFK